MELTQGLSSPGDSIVSQRMRSMSCGRWKRQRDTQQRRCALNITGQTKQFLFGQQQTRIANQALPMLQSGSLLLWLLCVAVCSAQLQPHTHLQAGVQARVDAQHQHAQALAGHASKGALLLPKVSGLHQARSQSWGQLLGNETPQALRGLPAV